jgi:hypothetical protein
MRKIHEPLSPGLVFAHLKIQNFDRATFQLQSTMHKQLIVH